MSFQFGLLEKQEFDFGQGLKVEIRKPDEDFLQKQADISKVYDEENPKREEAVCDLIADTLITNIEGLRTGKKSIPYTKKNARLCMSGPRFKAKVLQIIYNPIEHFASDMKLDFEESVKN